VILILDLKQVSWVRYRRKEEGGEERGEKEGGKGGRNRVGSREEGGGGREEGGERKEETGDKREEKYKESIQQGKVL
jgi:hypothetical protein